MSCVSTSVTIKQASSTLPHKPRCQSLDLFIASPATLATDQIRNEHDENESAECCTDNDWHQIADGKVVFAVRH